METSASFNRIALGIICPMANEKDTAISFINQVLKVCNDYPFKSTRIYLVVDLASRDGTKNLLDGLSKDNNQVRVIFSPENKNVVDAYKKGYQAAIIDNADWILEIDAGFSHRPEDIPKFLDAMNSGDFDCVFGSRFHKNGRMISRSLKRSLLSHGGTYLVNALLGTKLSDMTSGFELFKRDALVQILAMNIVAHGPFFQTEIRTFAHKFRITEVPIVYNSMTGHNHPGAISDAFRNLKRLCLMKIKGELIW